MAEAGSWSKAHGQKHVHLEIDCRALLDEVADVCDVNATLVERVVGATPSLVRRQQSRMQRVVDIDAPRRINGAHDHARLQKGDAECSESWLRGGG